MAWYDTGTVSVTNGSATVTGSGTNFIAGAQVGEAFYGPDGRLYEIQAIVSATSLTLADSYLGSTQTGQAYKIIPTQSLVATLASQVSTLISDFQTVADEAGEGKFDDGSAASPGITFTLDQDTGLSRPTANQIGFSTAGVQRLLLTSTGLTSTVDLTIPDKIIHSGDTNTAIRFPADDTVSIETGGAERMRVGGTNNGVGIGTGADSLSRLEVALPAGQVAWFTRTAGDAGVTNPAMNWAISSTTSFMRSYGPFRFEIAALNGSPAAAFTVLDDGKFGIATTTPATALDVNGDVTITDKIIHSGDTNTAIRFPAADTVTIETGGAERLALTDTTTVFNEEGADIDFRVESDTLTHAFFVDGGTGRVGINNSTPDCKFHITDSSTSYSFTPDVATEFILERNGNCHMTLVGSATGESRINFATPSSEARARIRFDRSTDVLSLLVSSSLGVAVDVNGNVGIGTTSPSQALDVVGSIEVSGGIYLGGTVAANLLDDYEEGTWTPVIADATTGGNLGSASIANANYIKVGNMVTVSAELTNIVTTGMTAANVLYIRGLPFTSSSTNQTLGSVKSDSVTFQGSRTHIFCIVDSSDTWALFQVSGSATTDTNVDVGDITSGTSDISFSITYFT